MYFMWVSVRRCQIYAQYHVNTYVHVRMYICNSYITGLSFVADILHGKSARAIARELLRAINQPQNEGT